jgi:hypothetical protein
MFVTDFQTEHKKLHAVAAVHLLQENTVLLHNCESNGCIYKMKSGT